MEDDFSSEESAANPATSPHEVPSMAIASYWRRVVGFDQSLHSQILAKYPRLLVSVDWLLEVCYGLFASPITALVVSLLLVPFVTAGSIPLVVWGSITLAWLLFVIGAARAEALKQLSYVSRFIVVVIIAIVSYKGARWYIRWSVVNYYAHVEPKTVPSENKRDNKNLQSLNPDDFYGRMGELIKKELRPYIIPVSPQTPTPNQLDSLDNTSLVAVAKVTAKEINDVMGAWKYQIEGEIEPRRDGQVYGRDPAPGEDEMNRLDDYFDKQIEEANQTYGSQARVLFLRAEALREVLVNRLAQKNSMPLSRDVKRNDVFKRLAANGVESFYDGNPPKISAHLLALSKRLERVGLT